MSQTIVDDLEAVQVHDDHGVEDVVAALAALQRLLDAVQGEGAVGQAGEAVIQGLMAQLGLELRAFLLARFQGQGHVVEGLRQPAEFPLAVPQAAARPEVAAPQLVGGVHEPVEPAQNEQIAEHPGQDGGDQRRRGHERPAADLDATRLRQNPRFRHAHARGQESPTAGPAQPAHGIEPAHAVASRGHAHALLAQGKHA